MLWGLDHNLYKKNQAGHKQAKKVGKMEGRRDGRKE